MLKKRTKRTKGFSNRRNIRKNDLKLKNTFMVQKNWLMINLKKKKQKKERLYHHNLFTKYKYTIG